MGRTMFGKAKYRYLSKTITIKSPASAREAVRELNREFDDAQTKSKRLRIARATQLAANRASVSGRRKNLSSNERRQYKQIDQIYSRTASNMFKKIR